MQSAQGTTQGIETHTGKCRECRYMGVVETYTGNHTGKCRECKYMVVGTVSLVQKGHPHKQLNPCRELNPHREHTTINLHSLCFTAFPLLPCVVPYMGPHHSHVPTLMEFPAWAIFALRTLSPPSCTYFPCISMCSLHAFLYGSSTTPMYLHSLLCLCGFKFLHEFSSLHG